MTHRPQKRLPRSSRSGLAPLELVLTLPFLLAILALIIDMGIEVKWKLRALAVSRQAVWRVRGGRNGATDPRPAGWPTQNASLAVIPAAPPPLFPQDPFVQNSVVRGPVLRSPNSAAPESQLLVDPNMLDLSGEVKQGQAIIDRKFPVFPKLPGVHLNLDHLLIDSQWRYWEQGFGVNETRRGLRLYKFVPPPNVQQYADEYRQAALAIINDSQRRNLDPLDRDEELAAWYGPPPPDFHPQLSSGCSLDKEEVHIGAVLPLVDRIQGRKGRRAEENIPGVPEVMAKAFLAMYADQLSKMDPMSPQAGFIKIKMAQIGKFLGTL
ncbi:MAG: pilus assembly protein [Planctomycetaceae bacterium]|nr:pilus assembly protein [Planctomycetaceae bacterium]